LKAKENPLHFVTKRKQEGIGDQTDDATLLHRGRPAQGRRRQDDARRELPDAEVVTPGPTRHSTSAATSSAAAHSCLWRGYYNQLMRKRIEAVFSQNANLLPKHVHAVMLDGFLFKVSMFFIAFASDKTFN
jgi:hypothetical protein